VYDPLIYFIANLVDLNAVTDKPSQPWLIPREALA
jgi:hypothetical protein